MSWSLGETSALSVKAARGAGFSWGEAEEVGLIVAWLHTSGAPGVAALAAYLHWRAANLEQLTETRAYFAKTPPSPACYCPISLGCAVQDLGAQALANFADTRLVNTSLANITVRQPLLLLPAMARAADQALIIRWESAKNANAGKFWLSPHAMLCHDKPSQQLLTQARCTAVINPNPNPNPSPNPLQSTRQRHTPPTAPRIPSSDAPFIAKLQVYADKTYAPATAASRLAGAGAGLTDND